MPKCEDCPAPDSEECPQGACDKTVAGPTVSYEEALLREEFGEPDENGVYGGSGG